MLRVAKRVGGFFWLSSSFFFLRATGEMAVAGATIYADLKTLGNQRADKSFFPLAPLSRNWSQVSVGSRCFFYIYFHALQHFVWSYE